MKIVLLLCLGIIPVFAQAQEDRPVSVEMKSTGYFIDNSFRAVLTPQVTWSKNRYTLGIGPALLMVSEGAIASQRLPKLVGLQANYRFYINGNDKKVNLYFFDELNLQRIKHAWTSIVWTPPSQQYQSYRYVNREYIVQNTAGYGIELPLARRWSLYQGVGIGLYYSRVDGDKANGDTPEVADTNGNGYAPFGFSWDVHLGVHFTL